MKLPLLLASLLPAFLPADVYASATASAVTGQSATFSVTVAGTQPFTYQWQKNAAAITGATASTYTLSPLKLTDAGNYTVTVLNSAGSTTSDVAMLTVTAAVITGPAGIDISKQYARVLKSDPLKSLAGKWTPIIGGPINDPGAHYSATTGIYTVGATEGGIYEVTIIARGADMGPELVSFALGTGTPKDTDTNWDGTGVFWQMTPTHAQGPGAWTRTGGALPGVKMNFANGALVRFFVYSQQDLDWGAFDISIVRLPLQ